MTNQLWGLISIMNRKGGKSFIKVELWKVSEVPSLSLNADPKKNDLRIYSHIVQCNGTWLKGKSNGFQIVFLHWQRKMLQIYQAKHLEENVSWVETVHDLRASPNWMVDLFTLRWRCDLEIMNGLERDYKFICRWSWHRIEAQISCEQSCQIMLNCTMTHYRSTHWTFSIFNQLTPTV